MRALSHIKKLSDEGGTFYVNVLCKCGYSRLIRPLALANIVGNDAEIESLAPRMRCSKCGKKDCTVTAVAEPRPRGLSKYPR